MIISINVSNKKKKSFHHIRIVRKQKAFLYNHYQSDFVLGNRFWISHLHKLTL